MRKTKGGLGRGLSAVIPAYVPGVEAVDVDLIVPNPHQPRFGLDPDALAELADSVRTHGVIQPLLVSLRSQQGGVPTYQIIAGERRLEAAKMAGLARVPVVIKEASSREALELALVENLQRADLTPLEEAQAYQRLVHEYGLRQEDVAQRVGKSRVAVANALRLLNLSDEIKASLAAGEISEGHARALLGLENPEERRHGWRIVVERGLNVRQTEALVRNWARRRAWAGDRRRPERRPAQLLALEERLVSTLGTKVEIRPRRTGGQIILHYFSKEELGALVQTLLRAAGGK